MSQLDHTHRDAQVQAARDAGWTAVQALLADRPFPCFHDVYYRAAHDYVHSTYAPTAPIHITTIVRQQVHSREIVYEAVNSDPRLEQLILDEQPISIGTIGLGSARLKRTIMMSRDYIIRQPLGVLLAMILAIDGLYLPFSYQDASLRIVILQEIDRRAFACVQPQLARHPKLGKDLAAHIGSYLHAPSPPSSR